MGPREELKEGKEGTAAKSLESLIRPFKGSIRGYFKVLLKVILVKFEISWLFSWLPLLSGSVKQRPVRAL